MHSGALRALEFDRIVDAGCRYAQTPPGRAALARLEPLTDSHAVSGALSATAATARFLADNHVGLQAPDDLGVLVTSLAVEGRGLEPAQLVGLAGFLASIGAACAAVRRARAACPILRNIADGAASFDHEIA